MTGFSPDMHPFPCMHMEPRPHVRKQANEKLCWLLWCSAGTQPTEPWGKNPKKIPLPVLVWGTTEAEVSVNEEQSKVTGMMVPRKCHFTGYVHISSFFNLKAGMYAFSEQGSLLEKCLNVKILRGIELVTAMKDKATRYMKPRKRHSVITLTWQK